MKELTLEQEFEIYKAEHKYAITLAFLVKYYTDLQSTGVKIPEWLDTDSPIKKAEKHLRQIYEKGELNNIYEKIYPIVAACLD